MQVNGVSSGYPDPTLPGRQAEPGQASGAPGVEVQLGSSIGPSTVLAEILSKYDVTDITPMEFSAMVQKLYEAGAISENELQQLSAIRHELDAGGVDPDGSLDLLEYYVDKIEKLQRRFDPSEGQPPDAEQLGPLLRRLDWIEKFALVQAAPDTVGFSAVA